MKRLVIRRVAFITLIGAAYLVLAAWPAASGAESYADAKRLDPDRIQCRRVQRKRSFTKHRVCATRRQWDEQRDRSLAILQQREQADLRHQMPGRR
ncbi:MAG: hypothetical protein O7H39_18105 [Gammaproteobacteria bacterium]|nr:hypothetical protein [Gammaproteobacteria bacterium]